MAKTEQFVCCSVLQAKELVRFCFHSWWNRKGKMPFIIASAWYQIDSRLLAEFLGGWLAKTVDHARVAAAGYQGLLKMVGRNAMLTWDIKPVGTIIERIEPKEADIRAMTVMPGLELPERLLTPRTNFKAVEAPVAVVEPVLRVVDKVPEINFIKAACPAPAGTGGLTMVLGRDVAPRPCRKDEDYQPETKGTHTEPTRPRDICDEISAMLDNAGERWKMPGENQDNEPDEDIAEVCAAEDYEEKGAQIKATEELTALIKQPESVITPASLDNLLMKEF